VTKSRLVHVLTRRIPQECQPTPAFVLPALPLDELLIRRIRPHRTTDPEARGNSLLPPEEEDPANAILDTITPLARPRARRTDSSQSVDTVQSAEDGLFVPPATLVYPGVAGPEADIGMRHSIRALTVPLWANRAWRDTFRRAEGDGAEAISVLELLAVKGGVDFVEFLQLVCTSARRAPSERRPLTVTLDLRPSAWASTATASEQTEPLSVKLIGSLIHADLESTTVTSTSYLVVQFAASVELPAYALVPPLRPPSLARGAHRPHTPSIRTETARPPSGRFSIHTSKQAKPATPGEIIGDGFILEGSTKLASDGSRPRKKRRGTTPTPNPSMSAGGRVSPLVTSPLVEHGRIGTVREEAADEMDVERSNAVSPTPSGRMNEDGGGERDTADDADDDDEDDDGSDETPMVAPRGPILPDLPIPGSALSEFQKRLLQSVMGRAILLYPCARDASAG
jgi:hypothetical protein